MCDENVEGSHSTYTRRDDYWGELPDAETVTIRHYSEATTMIADFENGALDIALDVAEADYLAAQDGAYGEVTTKLFPKWDLLAVCLPEYNPAFDDIRVREAISLALDTNSIGGRRVWLSGRGGRLHPDQRLYLLHTHRRPRVQPGKSPGTSG